MIQPPATDFIYSASKSFFYVKKTVKNLGFFVINTHDGCKINKEEAMWLSPKESIKPLGSGFASP
jgi:hypothetical protein